MAAEVSIAARREKSMRIILIWVRRSMGGRRAMRQSSRLTVAGPQPDTGDEPGGRAMRQTLLPALMLTALLFTAPGARGQGVEDPFYAAPSPLPASSPGWVLRHRPLTGTMALPAAARSTLVLYRSSDPHGRPIAVSGSVSLPPGTPPAGGWPVITWTHGTTGIAPVCAPSLDRPGGPEHDYITRIAALLDAFLRAGFAIVATDYQGLGAGDFHPFLQGVPNARNALDMIRAARELEPTLSPRFGILGHSQGGHAALFTAAEAPRHAPELELVGGVAMAPGSQIAARLAAVMAAPQAELALPYVLYVLQSYATTFPEVDLARILTPEAMARLPELRVQCMTHALTATSWATAIARDQFRRDAALGPFLAVAARNEPGGLPIRVPVMVMQGAADATVRPADTDRTVRRLCGNGVALEYRTFPGVDHDGVMASGAEVAIAWMRARFSGTPAGGNCAALPSAG
jgi:pimeloyl-ACP methyl ester carboxylesterase